MSVQAMTWVWKHSQAKPTDRFVLLAIADVASDEGEVSAYARSQSAIQRKTGLDRRTIQRSVDRLLDIGELAVLAGGDGRRSTDYYMPMGREIEGRQSAAPAAAERPPRGGAETPLGRQSAAPIIPSLSVVPPSLPVPLPSPKARASRLPDEFLLTPAMREWASAEAPHVDLRSETAKFCDHWRSSSGANARKLDWVAAWRNWIRRAGERNGNGHINGNLSKQQQSRANLAAWAALQTAAEQGAIGR